MPSIKKVFPPEVFWLLLISGIVFLPYAIRLTYYLDDWYYIYDGIVAGPNIFHSMFSIDRPIRGYFFDVFFSLFGPYPLPYHLGAYFWRLAAGVGAFWLLNIIWDGNNKINFLISLLFILYPGYSWWISAIEYQPMAASLALQIFSILFTLLSIQSVGPILKIVYAFVAVITGWVYIALVDYAVGAEVFRFLCIYLLISRRVSESILKRVGFAFRYWMPYSAIPLGFVIWRVFLFEGGRKATDIDLYDSKFITAPVDYLLKMGTDFYYSVVNAGVNAWFKQLYYRLIEIDFGVPVLSAVLTVLVAAILAFIGYLWTRRGPFGEQGPLRTMPREALVLGFVSLSFGALPVVVFGRSINLGNYSHYGLPVSFASAILLTGLVCYLPFRRAQFVVLSGFIVAAALTHSLLGERTLFLKNSLESFWWQAAWRIPGFRPDSTLVALYPYGQVVDDDLGLPEAANLIYFPEPRDENPVRFLVSIIMPTEENIEFILMGKQKKKQGYRTHEMVVDYRNIVVLTQPDPFSCIRVIDGENYIFSEKDTKTIRKIFVHSKIENIRMMESRNPQVYAFGDEPEHGWCYYFEKADLAVQQTNWAGAAQLGDKALALGLTPSDPVEWFPFVQAYAMTGNVENLKKILMQAESNESFNEQVCEVIHRAGSKFSPPAETKDLLEEYSCQ